MTIEIIDRGRGPQLPNSRLTVVDVFYYLHRGYDFDFIRGAMPSLSRPEFDAVVEYVQAHHEELVEKDRRVEERIQREKEALKARRLYSDIDESLPVEMRAARLKEKMRRQIEERNGSSPTRGN